MGQKVNPISFRLGVISTWDSSWYCNKGYAKKLHEDIKIRKMIFDKLSYAGVSKVSIERPANKIIINIHSSRPGVVIGKKGTDIAKIKDDISKITAGEVIINITEVKKAETEPLLIARSVAEQLEKRVSFRKAVKRAMTSSMKMGAKGVKISVSGRLGGAEIARTEWYREGRVPLHTLRAIVKYDYAEAHTIYGLIGVKVWVYQGDKLDNKKNITSVKNDAASKEN
ncbi:30S ribosomal protein S3 [Candidatus Bandiella euplotis]|uniref:Small ribosomal subunit protein uS3 n=1 Tax=Candidatus Bandiella euplotis TaxID=1664265 RepID=A0ABZ0UKY6_9RICK|nr:30S ribosomal protein S3 [Candidatus Bandiella woodruffii]WPX96776.1 30S ribosomal protein S3 [Candidatus Bandiella woodruffii]